jgi:type II secretory pathway pseudopilin PulG
MTGTVLRARARTRFGFSSVEALVCVVLSSLVVALVMGALSGQQRNSREASEVRAIRADLRDAAAVVARDLRGAAVQGDSFPLVSDTAIEFFAPILTGVTCAGGIGPVLFLSPQKRSGGGFLTSFVTAPDTGDLAWVFENAAPPSPEGWKRYRIAGFSQSSFAPCATDPVTGAAPFVLAVVGDVTGIPVGTPVQIVRRGRYSIYRSANGEWNLGYRRCDALKTQSCRAVQPVAGPYRVRAGSMSGMQFRFYGPAGSLITGSGAVGDVRRAEIIVRSDTTRQVFRARRGHALDDSVAVVVAFRNGT